MAQSKNEKKTTPFQEELIKAAKTVKEYKLACEANIVSIFFKKPDLMYDYQLKLEDFTENTWRVYWQIAYDIVIKEKKSTLDEITVGLYLEKHSKLKQKYDEYGGFDTIEKATEYVKIENINGYIAELNKWNTVLMLLKNKFPVYDRLSEFADMSLDDIYVEYEAILNHIFINADEETKSYSIEEGIDELIDELNEGIAVGLPYNDMTLLNKETGGQMTGNITLVGGLSNMGKTTLVRSMCIPSTIKHGEKLVIMINEEGKKKWQREMLVWVANNIYKFDLQKFVVRDGKYSDEVMEMLRKCADGLSQKQVIIQSQSFRLISIVLKRLLKLLRSMRVWVLSILSLILSKQIQVAEMTRCGWKCNKLWLIFMMQLNQMVVKMYILQSHFS